MLRFLRLVLTAIAVTGAVFGLHWVFSNRTPDAKTTTAVSQKTANTTTKMPHYYLAADTMSQISPQTGIGTVQVRCDGYLDTPALVRLPFKPIKGTEVKLINLHLLGSASGSGLNLPCVVIGDSTTVWDKSNKISGPLW